MAAENASGRPGGHRTAAQDEIGRGRPNAGTYSCFDEESRQTPLTFRFKHKEIWPEIRREIGGSETCAAVAISISAARVPTTYSRRNAYYSPPRRYRHPLWRYDGVVSAVDHLDRIGLIHHDRAPPGRYGWQSAMNPTDQLRQIVARILAKAPALELAAPVEPVILRDANGQLLDYDDTRATRRMRDNLRWFNHALRSASMSFEATGQLVRVFNQQFKRGGRFYCTGGGWQCLPSEERAELTLAGEPVVELDFSSLHPVILYSRVGARPPDDCYAVPGWPRGLVKAALLRIINAEDWGAARGSIAWCDAIAGIDRAGRPDPDAFVAVAGSVEAHGLAALVISDIQKYHKPIARYFFSGAGAGLMRTDSDISENIMSDMVAAGIPILPVHDSYIVPASKSEILKNSMLAAAEKAGIFHVKIRAK